MKTAGFVLSLLLAIPIISGCEKYDEGGSLARADKTITETPWKIQSAMDLEEGVDITEDYAGEVWEFTSDNIFKINSSLKGTYAFSGDMKTLIVSESQGSIDSYRIERLDKDAMWLVILGQEELRFVPY